MRSYSEEYNSQPEQEPASVTYKEVADTINALWGGTLEQVQMAQVLENKKLYTSPQPPQRKPLTDKQIDSLFFLARNEGGFTTKETFTAFARAIEAAHGIKE